ncbi:MAG: 50S ribosomal protein L6 [Deltaproteobacteria bacterium]|nr:50S ribosomal protein L6 [Deltaproteobacteria bacterium]MBW1941837.1 50S ribosomal protein L6 [Deltaproteobacteria bacterium]MBW2205373.1 50S ribosomal protein L6 [Deltaproteobacteria bacterium]
MSRIGKKPIPIPKDVKVDLKGDLLTVKGPKGNLQRKVDPNVQIRTDTDQIVLTVQAETKKLKSLHGLYRALVSNMVIGVSQGFERALEIVGVGYRAEMSGKTMVLHLGYSHPINYPLPEGVEAKVEKTKITLAAIDKEVLGRVAAKIRSFRAPEPYKGKGIRYAQERIRRKAGKTGVK